MSLYGQEPEVDLLREVLRRLENKNVIDVGAERGAFAQAMLSAGATRVDAVEPEPSNVQALEALRVGEPRLHVHPLAADRRDGTVRLHLSTAPDGSPIPFGHTVLERSDTPEIHWGRIVQVEARALSSLVENGSLPDRVGILKVDTEGNDVNVLEGLGELSADVIMLEHWIDLPLSLGPCPWTLDDVTALMRRRGLRDFAFVGHHGEFVLLEWNSASLEEGEMGNLVFFHADTVDALRDAALNCASRLARQSLDVGRMYATAARERLELVERLSAEIHGTTGASHAPGD